METKKLYLYETELFEIELFICIKMDLALNNLQWLMCHKTKPNDSGYLFWCVLVFRNAEKCIQETVLSTILNDLLWLTYWIVTFLVVRVFANGLGDLGSIPGCIIPKTLNMVLDTSLLNTQQYKVCIKGKVEQSRERSRALPYTSV